MRREFHAERGATGRRVDFNRRGGQLIGMGWRGLQQIELAAAARSQHRARLCPVLQRAVTELGAAVIAPGE
ncbi:MAG: hypothetical protein NTY41_09770, partial [Proteobacteria bacterium]|nr:hypothetical protein [Pseudomonadota bacterium]